MPSVSQIKKFVSLIHPVGNNITQGFGENAYRQFINGKWETYLTLFGMKGHNGIDYGCPTGTSIIMPCNAEIVDCYYENQNAGYGTNVVARTEPFEIDGVTYKLEMVFGHLKGFSIKQGQKVEQGQPFAISDNTGKYTTGAHLHWGVRLVKATSAGGWLAIDKDNGYLGYIDPASFIDYSKILEPLQDKVIYAGSKQDGAMHYLVKGSKLLWITDEVAYACAGFTFAEATSLPLVIVNALTREVYKIDYNSQYTKVVKLVVGLLKSNPSRTNELYKKHFNS